MSNPAAYSRKLGARALAFFAVAVAASWGPLANFLQICERISDDTTTTHLVFGALTQRETRPERTEKNFKDSKAPVERLSKAIPDSLESSHAIHFVLDMTNAACTAFVYFESSGTAPPSFLESPPPSDPPDAHRSRGPPNA